MTIVELIKKCKSAIDNPIADGKVALLVPGAAPKARAGKNFPGTNIRGEVVCEYDDSCLCAFDAKRLLDAIVANLPHVKIERREQ